MISCIVMLYEYITHLAMESHMPLLSLVSLKRSSFIFSAFFCTYSEKRLYCLIMLSYGHI